MSIVLVTGGTGFVGGHCIAALLDKGHTVRTTVRNLKKQDEVRQSLKIAGVDPGDRLSFFEADLLSDNGWKEAMNGCDYVLHVASPFPATPPKDENDLIRPAKEGTLRVLRFAEGAGVKRVVVTSSSVAVTYGHAPQSEKFTEESWTEINGASPITKYAKSKTLAEKAAWDFINSSRKLELAVVNPVGIFGPALSENLSASVQIVKQMLAGMPAVPKIAFNVVDVRDLADLHIKAMENPQANGQRFLAASDGFISLKQMAELLNSHFGDKIKKLNPKLIPDWVIRLMAPFVRDLQMVLPELGGIKDASNEKAKRLLGWAPRSKEESILATADSLIALGQVKS